MAYLHTAPVDLLGEGDGQRLQPLSQRVHLAAQVAVLRLEVLVLCLQLKHQQWSVGYTQLLHSDKYADICQAAYASDLY